MPKEDSQSKSLKEEEHLSSLVQRLRDGDDSVKHEIILLCLPQALRLVRRHRRALPNKSNDIKSMALLALVRSVGYVQGSMKDNNIRPFLTSCIRGLVHQYMAKDQLIPIPRDVWRELTKDYDNTEEAMKAASGKLATRLKLIDTNLLSQEQKEDTTPDMYKALNLSYKERAILELRMERRTLQEIAEILTCSTTSIHKTLARIQARYLRACNLDKELPRPK